MIRYLCTAAALVALLTAPQTLKAQEFTQIENVETVPFPVALNTINRMNPKQNPSYSRGTRILKRSITDSSNKVVGDIHEITLDQDGAIMAITTGLSRVRAGGGQLDLDYNAMAMRPVSSGYTINFDQTQIENQYADILANINTAAGEGTGSLKLSKLIGADVEGKDGRRIGKIEDVLFNELGSKAEAILIRVNYRNIRGESVAVPITTPEIRETGARSKVLLTKEETDTVLQYAENM